MGSEKQHTSSETWSDEEEIGRSLSPDHSSKDGLGRSYECTFCKRGFTNAQALGGHMNIHRKDKAKAKQQKAFTTTTFTAATKRNKEHLIVSSKSFKSIPNEEVQYLGSSIEFLTGDHIGCQFTPSNPNFPWNLGASQLNDQALNEEHLRVNLNLGIGTSEMENSNIGSTKVVQEDWFENEVDLELRLGHYP
ncbi:hypothetical protein L6452_32901 [Arctium lappa]|uniref:Uncharacterized protein n=1 Tax=Arctium lappa TaxID=4217 RepID=A0ACB8Z639_ARCLA|nr:hypothetical protein L6452_32901 [Arctium lappa]